MAKSFLVPINMNGLEIQNFLAHNLASAPTGVKGKLYFNTTDNKLYYHNGSAWVALTANTNIPKTTTTPRMDGTAAIGSETKYAAGDHVHPTDTSRAPNNHAAASTTYGVGSSTNYGHVKLSDSADSGAIDTTKGTAATPKAVSTAFSSACEYTDEEIAGLNLGAASQKDVDTTVSSTSTNLPTSAAVVTYVSGQIGAVDAMRFKGTLGTGGTITALPSSHKQGDTYRVITAGTYAGQNCEIGDLIIALGTSGTSSSDWTVAQTNIDGAITSAGTGLSKSGSTLNHSNSVTAKTTQALYPIKFDAQGHITASGNAISTATTSADGLMSASDKTLLGQLNTNRLAYGTATIAANQTSTTYDMGDASLAGYMATMGGSEVILDVSENSNGIVTFSVATAQSSAIKIVIVGALG